MRDHKLCLIKNLRCTRVQFLSIELLLDGSSQLCNSTFSSSTVNCCLSNMKATLVCALLLIVIKAECHWYPPGHSFSWKRPFPRPPFPYERHSNKPQNSQWYFHRILPGQVGTVNLGPNFQNADWICHNLRTDDMMIVKVENTNNDNTKMNEQLQHPQFGHPLENWNENLWHNPINGHVPTMDEGDEESPHNTDFTTSPSTIDRRETKEDDESSKYHYGKGLIDIRTGKR